MYSYMSSSLAPLTPEGFLGPVHISHNSPTSRTVTHRLGYVGNDVSVSALPVLFTPTRPFRVSVA